MPSQLTLKPWQAKKARSKQAEDNDEQAAGKIDLPSISVQEHAQRVCAQPKQHKYSREPEHKTQAKPKGAQSRLTRGGTCNRLTSDVRYVTRDKRQDAGREKRHGPGSEGCGKANIGTYSQMKFLAKRFCAGKSKRACITRARNG
jgi:hypothetical protein